MKPHVIWLSAILALALPIAAQAQGVVREAQDSARTTWLLAGKALRQRCHRPEQSVAWWAELGRAWRPQLPLLLPQRSALLSVAAQRSCSPTRVAIGPLPGSVAHAILRQHPYRYQAASTVLTQEKVA